MIEILRQGEAHGWVRPLEPYVVQEEGASARSAAEDLVKSWMPWSHSGVNFF